MMKNQNGYTPQQQHKNSATTKAVTTNPQQWNPYHKQPWILYLALVLSVLLLLSACKNSASTESGVNPADTVGLAAFKAQQKEDSLQASEQAESFVGAEQNNPSANLNDETDQSAGAIKSINDQNGSYAADRSSGAASNGGLDEPTEDSEPQYSETPTVKKKRFSNASKGALIGAGSGAVIGAVVSKKNRGLGAVIGAAVGGGAGYGIGKHKDNKEARGE